MPVETERYFPAGSTNKNNSVAALTEARNFYFNTTLPYIQDQFLIDKFSDGLNTPSEEFLKKSKFKFFDIFNKDFLYGIVDSDGDIISPIDNKENFKSIATNRNLSSYKLQNFIADSYNDFKNYLNMESIRGVLPKNSIFNSFTIQRAYQSFDAIYSATCLELAWKFREIVLADKSLDSKIKNQKDFNTYFLNFLIDHLIISPITKSRMALFYNIKTFYNGITFLISNNDPGDDETKYSQFFMDPGFFCFSDACKRFGFKIDINIPYILQADLNSLALDKYYKRYGITDINNLFQKRYKKLYLEDLDALKILFFNAYNIFLDGNGSFKPDINDLCSKQARRYNYITRPKCDFKTFDSNFSDSYWLSMYIYIKNLETNKNLTQEQYEYMIKTVNFLVLRKKTNKALEYVNSNFNNLAGVRAVEALQNKDGMVDKQQPTVQFFSTKSNIIFRG